MIERDIRSGTGPRLDFTNQRLKLITVYYTWIPDNLAPSHEARWLAQLCAEKRETIKRLRLATGRAASLLGLQLLKHGMQANDCADFDLAAVRFPRGGKPCCALPTDFNITHSGSLVACALSSEGSIGIDTERVRAIDIDSFGRFLHADEYSQVGGDRKRFFELWTQKEAIVKAHGDGGISNLRSVRVTESRGILGSRTWSLRALHIHSDYVTHVAAVTDSPVKIEYVEFDASAPCVQTSDMPANPGRDR